MRPRLALAASLALLAAAAPRAKAGEPPPAGEGATAKVRASIPVPDEDKGLAFEWEGDLEIAGEKAGTVRFSIDVGEWKGQPVWLTSEDRIDEVAGSKRTRSTSLYLARDLTLLRGEARDGDGSTTVVLSFARDGEVFKVTRHRETGEARVELDPVEVKAAPGTTYGRAAQLLFLKYAPKQAASYELPSVALDSAWPRSNEHEAAPDPGPTKIAVKGSGKFGRAPDVVDTWFATVRQGVYASEIHLAPKDRTIVGIESLVPPGRRVVGKGKAKPATVMDDDKPATNWRAAFFKFGHGYHLAVERWIVDAIHWPTMFEHEVATGGWNKASDGDLQAFRKAYVQEFLAKSKHRARAEADALLQGTIATSTDKTLPDGTYVLQTHPEYGGNAYHFRAVEGVWYLVRIDQ